MGGFRHSARPAWGAPNHFEQLNQLGRPEDHHHDVRPAADIEVSAAQSREESAIAHAVQALADAAVQLDTEATLVMNTPALRATAEAAADVLQLAGDVLGGDEFIVEQANQTLGALVALTGWQNQLGPRFAERVSTTLGFGSRRASPDACVRGAVCRVAR